MNQPASEQYECRVASTQTVSRLLMIALRVSIFLSYSVLLTMASPLTVNWKHPLLLQPCNEPLKNILLRLQFMLQPKRSVHDHGIVSLTDSLEILNLGPGFANSVDKSANIVQQQFIATTGKEPFLHFDIFPILGGGFNWSVVFVCCTLAHEGRRPYTDSYFVERIFLCIPDIRV